MVIDNMTQQEITKRNIRAKNNGDKAEQDALKLLDLSGDYEKIELINKLFDIVADRNYIEVKSCQRFVKNGKSHRLRHGLFSLYAHQHKALQAVDGVYMLIVYDKLVIHRFQLIRARDIPYSPQLTWTALFNESD